MREPTNYVYLYALDLTISTPGSTREPTRSLVSFLSSSAFQLTTPRGSRPKGLTGSFPRCYFNSRLHEGVDAFTCQLSFQFCISTHGSTKEPTLCASFYVPDPEFQLTAPQGSRPLFPIATRPESEFQLTAPQGSRHAIGDVLGATQKFQLTAPRGSRLRSGSGSGKH